MSKTVEAARALDRRLKDAVARSRRAEAEVAAGLAEMARRGLFRALGYPRIQAYAEAELDLPRGKAKELVEIARRVEALPETARAFRDGELPWTKARQVVRIATPETEIAWLGKARALTNRGLEEAVARERGEPVKVKVVLEMSPSDKADLDEAVRRLRQERGEAISLGEAVAELCRRAEGPPVERPGHQVVIHECPSCGAASRDAREGAVEVAPEELAAAKDDAEVLDLQPAAGASRDAIPVPREGHGRRLTISPAERRAVIARDRGRCAVCGTRHWLHIHHLERRSGDVAVLSLLCHACHKRLVHGGHVRLDGLAPGLVGTLADGSPLEGGRDHAA